MCHNQMEGKGVCYRSIEDAGTCGLKAEIENLDIATRSYSQVWPKRRDRKSGSFVATY